MTGSQQYLTCSTKAFQHVQTLTYYVYSIMAQVHFTGHIPNHMLDAFNIMCLIYM